MDNQTLGPATYFVTDTHRWAVSNVGLFTGSNNPQYKITVSNQFTQTVDPELFQTARLSASSLRYYGLGLENGFYNITLQFAETVILDNSEWKSLGRRIFDIYIQVLLILPNGTFLELIMVFCWKDKLLLYLFQKKKKNNLIPFEIYYSFLILYLLFLLFYFGHCRGLLF